MRVCLIHPPHYNSTEDRLDAPLGLLSIGTQLQEEDHEVTIVDLSGVPMKDWKIPEGCDLYGITVYIASMNVAKEIINYCRSVSPKAKIVCGGAHPTCDPDSVFAIGADIVVTGPGEDAMLKIIDDMPTPERLYVGELSNCLDYYGWINYSLVDMDSYKRKINGQKCITMATSRGCPYSCTPCSLFKMNKKVKFRSPKSLAYEILSIKKNYDIHAFNFQDDSFCIDKSRLRELCKWFRQLNISFRAHGRVGLDTKDDYRRLAEAGCSVIAWGIESGSQKMLDLMNKKVTVEQNYQAIQWAKEYGIDTRCFFIFGFPGETEETIEETKQFIERADPDQYFVSNFVAYPGTAVYQDPEKFGVTIMSLDYSNYLQIGKDGYGGAMLGTKWLPISKFKKLEKEFREWLSNRKRRGYIQEYEKEMENTHG